MIESPVADVSNVSNDGCGTITAGLFLEALYGGPIPGSISILARYGPGWIPPSGSTRPTVATGAAVTTLYHLCKAMAKEA